ncbi:MAG TPA: NAD-dependent epimerase/dehydratase family protein [Ilumatobacteraceae bacterium]|nr:NAD-dependent epimerase/dehydratase family protein [Ilumatobacteraceae bacterium]
MRALVTGVAGFIGSTLADHLISEGWSVIGADRFTAYYEEAQKRGNISSAMCHDAFTLVEADLLTADLRHLLDGVDVVFHLAAQPGVRLSWADGFQLYNELNVNLTQRLLEACRGRSLHRFVYASSSSVYGQALQWPTTEQAPTRPFNPYGVTKLAAELLCNTYAANFQVPTVSLRYFTVYGPRQRPDMAIHRMIQAARHQVAFPLYGDGSHIRDFTFVGDVVDATARAATAEVEPGAVLNVAGGSDTTVSDLLQLVSEAVGSPVPVQVRPPQPGDVHRTGGSIAMAAEQLDWRPITGLEDGVRAQVAWHLSALG